MSKLGSLYIKMGSPEGEMSGGCCEIDDWAADEIERLQKQVRVLSDALTEYMAAYNEHWKRGMPILEPMGDAAIAAVREPAPIDRDMLGNPIYQTRSPENDIYKQCPWKPVKQEGVPISALAAVREPADHIEHDLEKVRGPTSSPAGEGGDRG
jgi:hypothetical protein